MSLEIIVRPEAEVDIIEAAKWYDKNLNGLGEKFSESLDSTIHLMQQNPEAFPKVYKDVRRILLKRFPS